MRRIHGVEDILLGFEPKDAGSIPAGSVFLLSLMLFLYPPTVLCCGQCIIIRSILSDCNEREKGRTFEDIADFFSAKTVEKRDYMSFLLMI